MIEHTITGHGFQVLHSSRPWRIAMHAFEPGVNDLASFITWGRHLDSEEAFVLLEGRGWLVTAPEPMQQGNASFCIHNLEPDRILIVEAGERHAIILEEGARTLIIENEDMSRSVTESIPDALREQVFSLISV